MSFLHLYKVIGITRADRVWAEGATVQNKA